MIIILVSYSVIIHIFTKNDSYKLQEGITGIPNSRPELASYAFAQEVFKRT